MEQGTEKQVGQSVSYTIAGRELKLKPMSLGKMKKATLIFSEKGDNLELMANYLVAILDNSENEGLTKEWVQDNVTLPEAYDIIRDCRLINGLEQPFLKGTAQPQAPIVERELSEATPIPSV